MSMRPPVRPQVIDAFLALAAARDDPAELTAPAGEAPSFGRRPRVDPADELLRLSLDAQTSIV
jgi:hypothetical protein